jgi:Flp pilus assembly protein TadG
MAQAMTADKESNMPSSFRHGDDGRRAERGTALIEFTLILPMLLVMTVAAVDFGRAFFVKNVVAQAAREGVRLRAVSSSADSALVRDRVLTVANASNVTVQDLAITGPDAQKQVKVTVTAEFNWIFPGVFNLFGATFTNPMSLTGEAVMRNEGSS